MNAERSKRSRRTLGGLLAVALALGLVWFFSEPPADLPPATNAPRIVQLGPDEYYLTRLDYLLDANGDAKLDTILMPNVPEEIPPKTISPAGYIGPEACAECHQEYYDGFVETSHFKTSSAASRDTVLGSFSDGQNLVRTQSPNLTFEMLDQGDKLVQRMLLRQGEQAQGADFPFDLVTGSGKVGQTYLYWQGAALYQLHISYVTSMNDWVNSPGYIDGTADYARPVLPRCLDCHATYFEHTIGTLQFSQEEFILGVTCEKCHGPGEQHVSFHREHPDALAAQHIVNPNSLSVERNRELCQLCHGGSPDKVLQPPFSYRPGEDLSQYFSFPKISQPKGIHTNSQLPRLQLSRCFTESGAMTCTDCHNPHRHERGDKLLFSQRCAACHALEDCGEFETLGVSIGENCIDCHMPSRAMEDIVVMTRDEARLSPTMRDHWIKVWPEESNKILQKWKGSQEGEPR